MRDKLHHFLSLSSLSFTKQKSRGCWFVRIYYSYAYYARFCWRVWSKHRTYRRLLCQQREKWRNDSVTEFDRRQVALQPPSCQHSYATTDVHVSVCSEIKDFTFTSDSVGVETGLLPVVCGCVKFTSSFHELCVYLIKVAYTLDMYWHSAGKYIFVSGELCTPDCATEVVEFCL